MITHLLKTQANMDTMILAVSAVFQMTSRGQLYWFQKEVWSYVSLWEHEPTSHLIYYLCEQFPNEFMILIASFRYSYNTAWSSFVINGK